MKHRVMIIGGGTGGHISPGVAIYEEMKENDCPALFLTGEKDKRFTTLEAVEKDDLMFYRAPSLTKNIFKIPFFVLSFFMAMKKAKKIIKSHEVSAVVGMGGYVSAPALLAAKRMDVPIFLCEQNTVPGKVTKLFEKYARKIYVTFTESREYLKSKDILLHAGNPIRKGVLSNVSKSEAKKAFHLQHTDKVIFAIGGSQGALKINELIFGLKKKYRDELKHVGIIWSTGELSYDSYKEKIHNEMDEGSIYVSPFINQVGMAYQACDIAISRSGAGVMMELAAMGLPSIQIPYPHAAGDHQDKNADAFEKEGAAKKIPNDQALPDNVAPILLEILNNPRALKKMSDKVKSLAKSDAAKTIMNDINTELR